LQKKAVRSKLGLCPPLRRQSPQCWIDRCKGHRWSCKLLKNNIDPKKVYLFCISFLKFSLKK
jgi:hypothetical protein